MEESILSFFMSNLPEEWEQIPVYTRHTLLFPLSIQSQEYQQVEYYFYGAQIRRIQRFQNPFQYGRYILRRYMLQTTYEDTVFHAVHADDLDTALKFTCDYRRYRRRADGVYEKGQHPMFYYSFSDLLNEIVHSICDMKVLVLKILTNDPKTQCDYYVQYVVEFM